MPALHLDGVTRRFGELTAVDGVSFDVEDGEIVGLLGHNGAGKTTLIRVINGLLSPDDGVVRVLGLDPVHDGHTVRRRTGVLTEYPALDEYLSVRENLEVYAAISGVGTTEVRPRLESLLERLGLREKRDEPARGLSAGMKQRVALARALIHDPDILLLDEPTTNMDPVAAREVRDLILELVRDRGRTVLLSTHNLAEAELICDRVAIMRDGELLTIGPPTELAQQLSGVRGVLIATTPETMPSVAGALDDSVTMRQVDRTTVELTGHVAIHRVVAALVGAGVEVTRVEPMAATLEDLYVSFHRRMPADVGPPPPPTSSPLSTVLPTTQGPSSERGSTASRSSGWEGRS